uniref:Dynein axonemal assembly factor 4 n=1 Tax=Ciona savignyi TaxID=51511 RepID=H2YFR5_CIOSA
MPIIVKDYKWSETKEQLYITVPLKGAKASNVDLLCTPEFVKASYPPFLFEAVLYAPVNDEKSSAKIRDGCVFFTLVKETPEIWGEILTSQANDKAFWFKKKQEAIAYDEERIKNSTVERSGIKEENKKFALKQMMQLEEQGRSKIELEKETERVNAADEMNKWKEQKRREAENEKIKLLKEYENKMKLEAAKPAAIIDDSPADEKSRVENVKTNGEGKSAVVGKKRVESKFGPRKAGKIAVNFTPRVFPTPQRESKAQEEDEWLQKQADARKRMSVDNQDLAEHEKDPDWLKDKGAQLFSAGDYLAAVNAYNLAIKIQPKAPILFLNRSACHLKVRNLFKAAEDCSTALDLMQPAVDSNSKGRLKAHLRRAVAYHGLELYVEALMDYEAALKIDPHNNNIVEDANKLRELIQSSDL